MAMSRRGFTLVEMMLATVVAAVLSAALATLFIGIHRLVRQSYNDAELSLALRAEREKALFNAVMEGGNVFWAGLLSGKDMALSGGDAVSFTATGIRTDSGEPITRGSQRWTRAAVGGDGLAGPLLYGLTVSKTVGGETRSARAVVPAFGSEQPFDALRVFTEGGGE